MTVQDTYNRNSGHDYDTNFDREVDNALYVWAPFGFQPDQWHKMQEWDRKRSREWYLDHIEFFHVDSY